MVKNSFAEIGVTASGVLSLFVVLSGCAGTLRLHDESRAKISAGVKDKYAQADVLGVIEVEKKNLDNLLAEELKVVRDNHKLQVDFALLRIADDNTPMADTYTNKAERRLTALGYSDGFKSLRKFRLADIDMATEDRVMQENGELLKGVTRTAPPPCFREFHSPRKSTFPTT